MRKPKVKIGPELTVEANRWAEWWAEAAAEALQKETDKAILEEFVRIFQNPVDTPAFMKIAAKRIHELKARGYPQAWIEKDLEKLRGIL